MEKLKEEWNWLLKLYGTTLQTQFATLAALGDFIFQANIKSFKFVNTACFNLHLQCIGDWQAGISIFPQEILTVEWQLNNQTRVICI